jgi:hypothetical protein
MLSSLDPATFLSFFFCIDDHVVVDRPGVEVVKSLLHCTGTIWQDFGQSTIIHELVKVKRLCEVVDEAQVDIHPSHALWGIPPLALAQSDVTSPILTRCSRFNKKEWSQRSRNVGLAEVRELLVFSLQ